MLSRRVTSSAELLASCALLQQSHHAFETHAGERTLSEVFLLFGVIHQVTTDHAILTRITQEVIEDFASDNVQYLELRTTPKVLPGHPVQVLARCRMALMALSDIAFPCSSLLRSAEQKCP